MRAAGRRRHDGDGQRCSPQRSHNARDSHGLCLRFFVPSRCYPDSGGFFPWLDLGSCSNTIPGLRACFGRSGIGYLYRCISRFTGLLPLQDISSRETNFCRSPEKAMGIPSLALSSLAAFTSSLFSQYSITRFTRRPSSVQSGASPMSGGVASWSRSALSTEVWVYSSAQTQPKAR